MGPRGDSTPHPSMDSFAAAEHPLPTLGVLLGRQRCQGMESTGTDATGEPANTFSHGMLRRKPLIPPSPSPPPSNTHKPPAQLPGQGGSGFSSPPSPSKGHLGFRPDRASPCTQQANAMWSHWTRRRAWVGTEHGDLFHCRGTLAGRAGGSGSGGRLGNVDNGFLNSCCAEHCKAVPPVCRQGLGQGHTWMSPVGVGGMDGLCGCPQASSTNGGGGGGGERGH